MTDNAIDFYDRVTSGKNATKSVEVSHHTGDSINFDVHPVGKKRLLDAVSTLPEELFDDLEEAETREEAEQLADESYSGVSGVDGDVVEAFEKLCVWSLDHEDLTQGQVKEIVEEFNVDTLFGIGGEVMEFSFEEAGDIRDFQGMGSSSSS